MLNDDDPPRPSGQLVASPPLDRLGVAELQDYIGRLRTEIARAEGEITRKRAVMNAAHGVFRTPS